MENNNYNFDVVFKNTSSSISNFEGHVLESYIVNVNNSLVSVQAGLKHIIDMPILDIVPAIKKNNNKQIEKNTYYYFFLEKLENQQGDTLFDTAKFVKYQYKTTVWNVLTSFKKYKGLVLNKIKGGFSVGIAGLVTFLPYSLAAYSIKKKPLKKKYYTFTIIKINSKRNNLVVSSINPKFKTKKTKIYKKKTVFLKKKQFKSSNNEKIFTSKKHKPRNNYNRR